MLVTLSGIVIDARLGWYAVPESFKVYLKVDIDEAAKRAFNDEKRKDLENFLSFEEHKKALIDRFNGENKRYFNLYGVRRDDMTNYDLVVDTTSLIPNEVADIIIRADVTIKRIKSEFMKSELENRELRARIKELERKIEDEHTTV